MRARPLNRRPSRRLLVVGLAAVVASGLLPVAAAAEPTVGELRDRAATIGARLEELGVRSSQLDEDFNSTAVELERLEAQLAENRADVEAARAELEGHRDTAKQYAIDAYVTGGTVDDLLAPPDDHTYVSRRRTYLSAVNGDRQQVIDDVSAAEAELADREAVLDAKAAEIAERKATLDASRAELADVIAEQEELQSSVSGQLAEAVAAEQARIQEAREAAARAQAEAAAQQAAAERSTTTARAPRSTTTAASRRAAPSSSSTSTPPAPASRPVAPPPPPVVSPPSPPVGSGPAGAATAIAAARSVLGTPYRWAGASPSTGFDCSGLIMWAYAQAGRSLPHSSRSLRAMTRSISAAQLRPGDLVFGGSPIHHVGMYIGGGQMIHSPRTGDVVKISGIYSSSKPVSFGAL